MNCEWRERKQTRSFFKVIVSEFSWRDQRKLPEKKVSNRNLKNTNKAFITTIHQLCISMYFHPSKWDTQVLYSWSNGKSYMFINYILYTLTFGKEVVEINSEMNYGMRFGTNNNILCETGAFVWYNWCIVGCNYVLCGICYYYCATGLR
jgi:hypothetical protein